MKTRLISCLGVAALAIGSTSTCLNAADNDASPAPGRIADSATDISKSRPEKPLPRNVADVAKLVKSGVDESVVKAFIDASPISFKPSASDLVRLRDEGIPSQVIVAMLKHEVEPAQPAPSGAAPPAPATLPAEVQQPLPAPAPAIIETTPSPTVIYSGRYPDYSFWSYPYNYYYGWPFSFTYYSGFHRGYYPYRRFGYHSWNRPFYPVISHRRFFAPRASFGVSVGGFRGGVRVGGAVRGGGIRSGHFGGHFGRR